jgi:hypothetical protein
MNVIDNGTSNMKMRTSLSRGNVKDKEYTLPDDISYLKAEDDRLDKLHHEINRQRALVRRKLNCLSSATRVLPSELLSHIFTLAYPSPSFSPRINLQSFDTDEPAINTRISRTGAHAVLPEPPSQKKRLPTPLMLGAVCQDWRQVAWNTPSLWSSLDLRPFPSKQHLDYICGLLDLYIKNGGSAGLNLEIVIHWAIAVDVLRSREEFSEDVIPHFGERVFSSKEVTTRIRTLVLSNPPVAWFPYLSKGGFTNLHTLTIIDTVPEIQPSCLTLTNVPSLRHLSLWGIQDSLSLPFGQLQSLTLRDMPIDVMFELLISAPNITSFRTISSIEPRISRLRPQIPETPITLSNIQHFEWSGLYDHWSKHFQHLRLPSLRYLHFHEDIPVREPGVIPWFCSLPETLKTLHLTRFWDINTVKDVLSSLPQLETVILEKCNSPIIPRAFEALEFSNRLPLPTKYVSTLTGSILPNLRKIKIEHANFTADETAFPVEASDSIARALLSRMWTVPHGATFTLEISPPEIMRWSPEAVQALTDVNMHDPGLLRVIVGGDELIRGGSRRRQGSLERWKCLDSACCTAI